jgi:hypothetical protein
MPPSGRPPPVPPSAPATPAKRHRLRHAPPSGAGPTTAHFAAHATRDPPPIGRPRRRRWRPPSALGPVGNSAEQDVQPHLLACRDRRPVGQLVFGRILPDQWIVADSIVDDIERRGVSSITPSNLEAAEAD